MSNITFYRRAPDPESFRTNKMWLGSGGIDGDDVVYLSAAFHPLGAEMALTTATRDGETPFFRTTRGEPLNLQLTAWLCGPVPGRGAVCRAPPVRYAGWRQIDLRGEQLADKLKIHMKTNVCTFQVWAGCVARGVRVPRCSRWRSPCRRGPYPWVQLVSGNTLDGTRLPRDRCSSSWATLASP